VGDPENGFPLVIRTDFDDLASLEPDVGGFPDRIGVIKSARFSATDKA